MAFRVLLSAIALNLMLLSLDIREEDVPALSAPDVAAIENIGSSVFHGRHVVIGRRPLLKVLAQDARLSQPARAAYTSVLTRVAEADALDRRIEQKALVSNRFVEPELVGTSWKIPLARLREPMLLSKPVVLAENLTDATLYAELGRWYGFHARIRAVMSSCRPAGGGGNTLSDELRARKLAEELTFCFADSDRDYPTDTLGETARRCLHELPQNLWHARLLILNERELENLIPCDWLASVASAPQHGQTLTHLRLFDDLGLILFRFFADLKTGFVPCDLLNATQQQVRHLAIAELTLMVKRVGAVASCCTAGACADGAPCFGETKLSDNVIAQVSTWLTSVPSELTRNIMTNPRLLPIARAVFEWSVASPKIRA